MHAHATRSHGAPAPPKLWVGLLRGPDRADLPWDSIEKIVLRPRGPLFRLVAYWGMPRGFRCMSRDFSVFETLIFRVGRV